MERHDRERTDAELQTRLRAWQCHQRWTMAVAGLVLALSLGFQWAAWARLAPAWRWSDVVLDTITVCLLLHTAAAYRRTARFLKAAAALRPLR